MVHNPVAVSVLAVINNKLFALYGAVYIAQKFLRKR